MARRRLVSTAKLPATARLLHAARGLLDLRRTCDRQLWGATVLAFFFLCRQSEFVGTGSRTCFAFRVADISFDDDLDRSASRLRDASMVSVFFRGSKTDQGFEGTSRSLCKSECSRLCPVAAAWCLVRAARKHGLSNDDPLCASRSPDGSLKVLQGAEVSRLLKKAARRLGLDPRRYSCHSLRIGGATAMFEGGCSDATIQLFGRWKSDVFKKYVRISRDATRSIAARMVRKTPRHLGGYRHATPNG